MEDLINNWDNILIDVKKYNIKINALLKKAKVSDSKFEKNKLFVFFKSKWYKEQFDEYENEAKKILFDITNKEVEFSTTYDGEFF
jgi:hypothetical protein